MKMPPNSPDMEQARDNIHRQIANSEKVTLDYLEKIAQSGLADKRWCAIARTQLEQGFMALQRSLRDYPGDDPNNYGKVPLDTPLPKDFSPPSDMPDQFGRDRNIAPPAREIPWRDLPPDDPNYRGK